MCSNDLFAYYTARILKKNNLSIPRDFSLTGFDGIAVPPYLKSPCPKLTSVFANRIKLGKQAVDYLLDLIQKPKTTPRAVSLETELRVGETVRRI